MVTDPISDLIIRLKNASDARKTSVVVLRSKLIENIAHTLKKAGFVAAVGKADGRGIELGIAYQGAEPRIHGVQRLSKPSRRMYHRSSDIRTFKSGFGATIYSTPKGVMIDMDARKHKVGGEVLFRIW